jgi:hypothetical protein
MHPGVGPSGAQDRLSNPAREAGQRGLELSLDGPGARLDLEARELRAVIFDRGPIPGGSCRWRALSGAFLQLLLRDRPPAGSGRGAVEHPSERTSNVRERGRGGGSDGMERSVGDHTSSI